MTLTKIKHVVKAGDSLYIPLPKAFAEILNMREYSVIRVTLDEKRKTITIMKASDYEY